MSIILNCRVCKTAFSVRPYLKNIRKTCSRECKYIFRMIDTIAKRPHIVQPSGSYRLIPLTKGRAARVSATDFDKLSVVSWHVNGDGYVVNSKGDIMSRAVMRMVIGEIPNGLLVDHENGDRLNNERSNLRLATGLDNSRNRRTNMNSKSGFKGVTPYGKKYQCAVSSGGKQFHVGYFEDPLVAAWYYDQFAIQLHGDFCSLNFDYI